MLSLPLCTLMVNVWPVRQPNMAWLLSTALQMHDSLRHLPVAQFALLRATRCACALNANVVAFWTKYSARRNWYGKQSHSRTVDG